MEFEGSRGAGAPPPLAASMVVHLFVQEINVLADQLK
jgi:hypothetical protein